MNASLGNSPLNRGMESSKMIVQIWQAGNVRSWPVK